MTDAETHLEICSFHAETLSKEYKDAKFEFYAFNLSTGQALPVTSDTDNVLSIHKHDIHFSRQSPLESNIVQQLHDIIDRPWCDIETSQSNLSKNFRIGLKIILSLYSSCTTITNTKKKLPSQEEYSSVRNGNKSTQPENLNIHEISFIELTFSIVGHVAFKNNFAAIVPISNKDGKLTTLLPFHGSIWEEAYADANTCFIQSPIKLDTKSCDFRVLQLRTLYGNRDVMFAGSDVLIPFLNKCAGRENTIRKKEEEYMIMHQNTETYVMMYGILVSIGRSQVLMTDHSMYMEIVQNILLTALNLFGSGVNVSSPDLINNFFSVLCYCMHMGQLGLVCYRPDILGEDIRKRYAVVFFKFKTCFLM